MEQKNIILKCMPWSVMTYSCVTAPSFKFTLTGALLMNEYSCTCLKLSKAPHLTHKQALNLYHNEIVNLTIFISFSILSASL